MKRKIYTLFSIFSLFFFFYSSAANATKPLPEEFESMYNQILKDSDFANMGNPKGTYVIIDFFDYRCDFCKELHKTLAKLVQSKEGRNIRWISIETPVFGYKYNYASNLILSAKKQKKYNQLFLKAAETGTIVQSTIREMFQQIGGDVEKLKQDFGNSDYTATYKKHFKLYKTFKTKAVPVLIINKKYQMGGFKEGQLEQVIKESQPKRKLETPFLKFF